MRGLGEVLLLHVLLQLMIVCSWMIKLVFVVIMLFSVLELKMWWGPGRSVKIVRPESSNPHGQRHKPAEVGR